MFQTKLQGICSRIISLRVVVTLVGLILLAAHLRPAFIDRLDTELANFSSALLPENSLAETGDSLEDFSFDEFLFADQPQDSRHFDKQVVGYLTMRVFDSLNLFSEADAHSYDHSVILQQPPEQAVWAAFAADKLTIVIALLFLTLCLPRLGWLAGFLSLLALTVAFATVHVVGQVVYQLTLPTGTAIQLALAGYLLMVFWLKPYRANRNLVQQRDALSRRLAQLQIQQGQLAEATETLSLSQPQQQNLALYYDIAQGYEQKRDYHKAATSYEAIGHIDPAYRDAASRAQTLKAFLDGPPGSQTLAQASTLAATPETAVRPTLGRYQIERELGRGAMGVVYLGRDPKISRQVAIKTLDYNSLDSAQLEQLKPRFFSEAKAAGRLSHPHIVTVYDVGEERDMAYIAMDYLQAQPLSDFAKPGALLPITLVYQLMQQVAQALAYAHEQGVIHRDIKPANILYNRETGVLKVVDFGIAHLSDDAKTRTGMLLGSPLYMSPEQLTCQPVTPASDVFALGITFYQLLTGEQPFQADSMPALMQLILNRKHPNPRSIRPQIPASAVRIINRALQKQPDKRFASARELADTLARAMSKAPIKAA